MARRLFAVCAIMLATAGVVVEGFQQSSGTSRRAFIVASPQKPRWQTDEFALQATVYYPDSWTEEEGEEGNTLIRSDLFGDSSGTAGTAQIPEALSSRAWTAPLARLAAGHCRSGGLKMEHIEQVSVRAVAFSHVDIEAVVCEEDGCVSLSVPVAFEHPCEVPTSTSWGGSGSGELFEDCILRNIQALDDAQLEAAKNRVFVTDDEIAASTALRSTEYVDFPSWWVHPSVSLDFSKECDSLLRILNEADFQGELLVLASSKLLLLLGGVNFDESAFAVREVAVVAVGPAGLVLRASTIYNNSAEMVEVPIAFAHTVSNPESLRDAVLDCIEDVCPVD